MTKQNIRTNFIKIGISLAFMLTTALPAYAEDIGVMVSIPFGKDARPSKQYTVNMVSGDMSNYFPVGNTATVDLPDAKGYVEMPLLTGQQTGVINAMYRSDLTNMEKIRIGAGGALALGGAAYLAYQSNSDDDDDIPPSNNTTDDSTDGTSTAGETTNNTYIDLGGSSSEDDNTTGLYVWCH